MFNIIFKIYLSDILRNCKKKGFAEEQDFFYSKQNWYVFPQKMEIYNHQNIYNSYFLRNVVTPNNTTNNNQNKYNFSFNRKWSDLIIKTNTLGLFTEKYLIKHEKKNWYRNVWTESQRFWQLWFNRSGKVWEQQKQSCNLKLKCQIYKMIFRFKIYYEENNEFICKKSNVEIWVYDEDSLYKKSWLFKFRSSSLAF